MARSILICDDSALDRHLLWSLLSHNPELALRECGDGEAALEELERQMADLVVTDLTMPRRDGLGLVREIKSRWPALPVVLVTSQGSDETALLALRHGAASYSPKQSLAQDLLPTVEFVLDIASHSMPRPGAGGSLLAQSRTAGPAPLANPLAHILENDCRLIGPLIEHLQDQLPHWSEQDRLQIGMAVGEALANAMHHGNLEVSSVLRGEDDQQYHQLIRQRRGAAPWAGRKVHVSSLLGDDEIRISIRDEGPGFDQASVPDPTAPGRLEQLSGRGLLLIRSFMDEVRYRGRGNEIEMVKRRR